MRNFRDLGDGLLSPGVMIVLAIAVVSGVTVAFTSVPDRDGREFWLFATNHDQMYEPVIDRWNAAHAGVEDDIDAFLISGPALERRMMSGFYSGTPVADLIEVEINVAGRVFAGPVEDVGFLDLKPRLAADGLLGEINPPSLTPYTRQGRIFGLPHDVHPVMLAYDAVAFGEAGIDVSEIETWDDYMAAVRPLMTDEGAGRRYALNIWYTDTFATVGLMRQAGGGLFDLVGNAILDAPANARVVARVVSWCGGPDRVAIQAPEFNPMGNKLRLDGRVLGTIMPDWLAGVWMMDLPGLSGRIKLMPLPAWEPGGRRTSVLGGTMLGITRQTDDPDAAYAFAKNLYFNPAVAEELYRESSIVSPIRALWGEPFYDEPVAYFSGQPVGRMYLDLAPDVPGRASTPFRSFAEGRLSEALLATHAYAEANGVWDAAALEPVAARELAKAQARVEGQMARNVFYREKQAETEGAP